MTFVTDPTFTPEEWAALLPEVSVRLAATDFTPVTGPTAPAPSQLTADGGVSRFHPDGDFDGDGVPNAEDPDPRDPEVPGE